MEAGDYESARGNLKALRGRLAKVALTSPWVEWALAVAQDMTGDGVAAFQQIQQALEVDPLNGAHHKSYEIITNKLKQGLMSAKDDDTSIARTYALLRDAGECDVPCHLAWARHLMHGKRFAEANTVLRAVTLTAPASLDAWRLRSRLARLQGDEAQAAACEAEVHARNAETVAFSLPATGGQS
jgi:predicted Zn-dependent protease